MHLRSGYLKQGVMTGEMAQRVKSTEKSETLSLIPRGHIKVEGES